MQSFTHIVQNPAGIHAKPAIDLSMKAKSLSSQILMDNGARKANVKNVASLLSMHISCQQEVTFEINGPNEIEDSNILQSYCKTNV